MSWHAHDLEGDQQELFVRALVAIDWLARETQGLDDRVALDVIATLRKTQETRAKGVLYDHAPEDARIGPLVQLLGDWLRSPFAEGLAGPRDADLAKALAAAEGVAKDAVREAGVARSTEFLAMAARVAGEMPMIPRPSVSDGDNTSSSLIVP